jgi:nitrogenase molybdenum-iron protein alpha/beta subunit
MKEDIVVESEYEGLGPLSGPSERDRSARVLTLNNVRQNVDGTTIAEVASATGLPKHRVRTILSELEKDREIYSRRLAGSNATIYYPNGRLIHPYLRRQKELGTQIIRVSFHEGRKEEPRVQIQERSFTISEGEKVEGSIYIDYTNLPNFIDFLNEMKEAFDNYKR